MKQLFFPAVQPNKKQVEKCSIL